MHNKKKILLKPIFSSTLIPTKPINKLHNQAVPPKPNDPNKIEPAEVVAGKRKGHRKSKHKTKSTHALTNQVNALPTPVANQPQLPISPVRPKTPIHRANADTGTTGNYFAIKDISMLRNVTKTDTGIAVMQPDGSSVTSTHTGILDIPTVGFTIAHIFPTLVGSLISISVLVDLGLTATYTDLFVIICKGEREVLRGDRDLKTGLWMLDLHDFTQTHTAALAIQTRTQAEVAAFWHGAFGSPALSTLTAAMDKGFISIPGISAATMRKHKPNPVATSFGHLDQTRQGYRSTKPGTVIETVRDTEPKSAEDIDDCTAYPAEPKNHVIVKFVRTGRNYMDLAGRFPHQSARGSNYIMIMYSHDTGYIHVETPASRCAADIVSCFERGIEFFSNGQDKPVVERIDNECSKEFRMLCKKLTITIELAPPGQHRTNAAERAIRTFKNHFISVLSTTDKNFPLDELVAQAEITLNLMRTCRSNTQISAYEAIRGAFDMNKTPIAPAGTRVVIHVKPDIRASWNTHGDEGFYIGPALDHYRCYRCWVISTAAIRVTDTVAWHPEKLQMPGDSPMDAFSASINDLAESLRRLADNPALAHTGNQSTR